MGLVTFSDPEPYQTAISPAQVEILVTGKGQCRAALAELELNRLRLQRGRENLPRVAKATVKSDRLALFFLASADQASTHHSGRVLAFGEIVASAAGSTHHLRTEGPCHWATLSMTREDFAGAGHALIRRDPIEQTVTRYIRPSSPTMSRLQILHQTVAKLAEHAPSILAQPEAARALEQALVHAMVMCVSESKPVQMALGAFRHRSIIGRFEELLEDNCNRPLHLAEVCAALGTSERTLRSCCMEHLGMGPIRYLWLRRMHLAHHALVLAEAAKETVTQIATGNGFFELGRFSVEYRALFGETPSATLHQPPQDLRPSKGSPFAFAESDYAL